MSDLTAFVLAGGKSTRMGEDKASLAFKGRTLLQRALDLAHAVAGKVRIVGDRKKFSAFGPTIEDLFPHRGPLGGIHAALQSSNTDLNLILAVDMPLLTPEFLQHLLAQARATSALVTVPRCGGGWQPLCAVYRSGFLAVAAQALQSGHNKIDPLFARVPVSVLEEADLGRLGFGAEIFRNLNTPEDLQRASGEKA